MEKLPLELLAKVGEHLSIAELKRGRLVNAAFALCFSMHLFGQLNVALDLGVERKRNHTALTYEQVATPCKDRDVVVGHTPSALTGGTSNLLLVIEKLQNVTSRPQIARRVHTLSFGLQGIGNWCHEYGWCDQEPYDPSWLILQYLDTIEIALRAALPRLPAIKRVRTLGHCPDWWTDCSQGCMEHLRVPLDELTQSVLVILGDRGTRLAGLEHTMPRLSGLAIYSRMPQMRHLLRDLRSLRLRVDKPHGRAGYHQSPIAKSFGSKLLYGNPGEPSSEAVQTQIHQVLSLVDHLRELRISLGHPRSDTEVARRKFSVDLDMILAFPLRDCQLDNVDPYSSDCEDGSHSTSDQRPSDTGFMNHLALHRMSLCPDCIMRILSKNRTSLEVVSLERVLLRRGSWAAIFKFMSGSLPMLREVSLEYLGYDATGALRSRAENDFGPTPYNRALSSSEPRDFEELASLTAVVTWRAETHSYYEKAVDQESIRDCDSPVLYGPAKRPHNLLTKWLGIKAM